MRKLRAGDTYTFALIFHQFYLDLCFFSKRILDQPRAAEHIVENAFVALWSSRRDFDDLVAVKSFLYSTTRDACFAFIDEVQKGLKDEELSAYIWQESSQYMEKEIIRPEVPREIQYNPIENLPSLCRNAINQS